MEEITVSPNQMIAASLIATGETKKKAAKAAKVSPQTISTWMQLPEFVAVINYFKIEVLREAQDKLRGLTTEAISCLASLLKDSENERIRLDACKYVLESVKIVPTPKELGLWIAGPDTYEGVVREQALKEKPLLGLLGDNWP